MDTKASPPEKLNGQALPSPGDLARKPKRKKANRTGFPVKKKKKKQPAAAMEDVAGKDSEVADKEVEDGNRSGERVKELDGDKDEDSKIDEDIAKGNNEVHEIKDRTAERDMDEKEICDGNGRPVEVDKTCNELDNMPLLKREDSVRTCHKAKGIHEASPNIVSSLEPREIHKSAAASSALKETNVKLISLPEENGKVPSRMSRRKRRHLTKETEDVLDNIENKEIPHITPVQREKKSLSLDVSKAKKTPEEVCKGVETDLSEKEMNGLNKNVKAVESSGVIDTSCKSDDRVDPLTEGSKSRDTKIVETVDRNVDNVNVVDKLDSLNRRRRKAAVDDIDEQVLATRPRRAVTQKKKDELREAESKDENKTTPRPKRSIKKVVLEFGSNERIADKSRRKQRGDKEESASERIDETANEKCGEQMKRTVDVEDSKEQAGLRNERLEEVTEKDKDDEKDEEAKDKMNQLKSKETANETIQDSNRKVDDSKENVVLDVRIKQNESSTEKGVKPLDTTKETSVENLKEEKIEDLEDFIKSSRVKRRRESKSKVEKETEDLDETKEDASRLERKTKSKEILDSLTPAKKSRRIELRKKKKEEQKQQGEKEDAADEKQRKQKGRDASDGGKRSRGKSRDDSDNDKKKKGPSKWGKRYLTAGLLSDTYKEDEPCAKPAERKLPKVIEDIPGGLLPPPAYCNKWVRQRRMDFKLPHDLWWLHTHNQLPGRNAVPSWNYKKIRNNVYYDIKPNYRYVLIIACLFFFYIYNCLH